MNTTYKWYANKRVLVTGGAGFIGSHIVDKLAQAGAIVTVLDDLSTGDKSRINHLEHKITFIHDSIHNQAVCTRLGKNTDILFHLAALVSIPHANKQPDICFERNIAGTQNILEAARINTIPHVIFSSSAAVYGPYQGICTEQVPTNPISVYGYSKHIGEILCKQYTNQYQLRTTILRYFNVYGTGQTAKGPYASAMAQFRQAMQNNTPITIFGDGTQTRDFISVDQVADVNLMAGVDTTTSGHTVYNVATGTSRSLNHVISELRAKFPGYSAAITYAPERSVDIKHSQADCSKLSHLLNRS